jgi:hypothetical protein
VPRSCVGWACGHQVVVQFKEGGGQFEGQCFSRELWSLLHAPLEPGRGWGRPWAQARG